MISMNILRELGFTEKQVTVDIGNTTVKLRKLEIHKRLISVDGNTRMLLENVFNKYENRFTVVGNNSP